MRASSKQSAGDNSRQIVVQGNYIEGITEERALEIAEAVARRAIEAYSEEAQETAAGRMADFDEVLVRRLTEADLLSAFRDPGFEVSLRKAQIGAACTPHEDDYALLSELLIERVAQAEHRPTKAGIERAIEVVDKIDGDALRALTLVRVATLVNPLAGTVDLGLDTMQAVFQRILDDGPLPTGRDWIEHLDILDAVRTDGTTKFKNFDEFFPTKVPGHIASGIPADSDRLQGVWYHFEADTIRVECVEHEFKEGFLRLPFATPALLAEALDLQANMTPERKARLLELADRDGGLNETGDSSLGPAFMERARQRSAIAVVAEWWNQIPTYTRETAVGRVLARANAQRLGSGVIPDLSA